MERVLFGGEADVPGGRHGLCSTSLSKISSRAGGTKFRESVSRSGCSCLVFENTVHVCYTLLTDHHGVRVELSPGINFRGFEDAPGLVGEVDVRAGRLETAGSKTPPLRVMVTAAESSFLPKDGVSQENFYSKDGARTAFARRALGAGAELVLAAALDHGD